MGDTAAALRMLDTFASCGAESFFVTKTELEWPGHKQVKWGKEYLADDLRRLMPAMVRTAAIRRSYQLPDGERMMAGENVIIRPIGQGVAFVQLDDLNVEQLDRVRPAVFIIHATSQATTKAWMAVSGVPEGQGRFQGVHPARTQRRGRKRQIRLARHPHRRHGELQG